MAFSRPFIAIFAVVPLLTVLSSCATPRYPLTRGAGPEEVTGTYTLILHGGRYSEDVENVAILDKDGDQYTFEVYAPEYDYTVREGVPASEALSEAEKFVMSHRSSHRSRLAAILDKNSMVIGYELRPLYFILEFGYSDILYIGYTIKDNRVITRIWNRLDIENREPFLFRAD